MWRSHMFEKENSVRVKGQDQAEVPLFLVVGIIRTTHPMVRLEIVDLFPKNQNPQVLAKKLDHVEVVAEPRPVTREAVKENQSAT